jgi:hypothetical protein
MSDWVPACAGTTWAKKGVEAFGPDPETSLTQPCYNPASSRRYVSRQARCSSSAFLGVSQSRS